MLLLEARDMDPDRKRGFVCDPAGIALARGYCAGILQSLGIEESEAGLVILGLDEILTNIYRHAYGGRGGDIVLEIAKSASGLELVIEHMGVPGSPVTATLPSDRRPGGRGLGVIRRVFHEFTIEGSRPPWTIRATRHLTGTLPLDGC
jgi:anti-sigma regulatory factor (Ser/Thr protein kinase)